MDLDFPFAPDRNFYYLTGLTEPGYIFADDQAARKTFTAAVPCKADPYLELYHGKMPTAEELQKQACLDQAHYLDKLDWELGRLFSRNSFEVPLHGFPQAGTGYHGLSGTRPGKKELSLLTPI